MGHTEVVQYLYSRGADLNSVQYGGRTPLLNAAFAEEGEGTALFLVSTGAVTDQGGNSKSIKSFEVFFGIFFRQFFTPFDAVCIQGGWGGCPTGKRKKLSCSQEQLGQATCLAVA